MDSDKKERLQHYSSLTTQELIELRRNPRMSSGDLAAIDDTLDIRGIPKSVRENLKNSPASLPEFVAKPYVEQGVTRRPFLLMVIMFFAAWSAVFGVSTVMNSKSLGAAGYHLVFVTLNIGLLYGLWTLQRWAWKYLVFVYALKISVAWLFVVLYQSLEDGLGPLIASLNGPTLLQNVFSNEQARAAIGRVITTSAVVSTAFYGALLFYLFRDDVRGLFSK